MVQKTVEYSNMKNNEKKIDAEHPLVSVIIPTYKRSDLIRKTIDSVLHQTYENIEIIVVDDNGRGCENQIKTEQTLHKYIVEKKIIYLVHEKNKNGSAARNTGLSHAKGTFVNFLDDDDFLHPTKIEKSVNVLMDLNNQYRAAYCNSEIWAKRFNSIIKVTTNNHLSGSFMKEYLLGKCLFNTSAILFRMDAVKSLNGFDDSFVRHQDYEFMVRFFEKYKIKCVGNEPLLVYDITSDRFNNPNSEKKFVVAQKFLKKFEKTFKKEGIKKEIFMNFYVACMDTSIREKKYHITKQAYLEARKEGFIGIKNIWRLTKAFIRSFIR